MTQLLRYLLRLEILVLFIGPIPYGLWLWFRRRDLNLRRTTLFIGALEAFFFFTLYISLGKPAKPSDIPFIDWLVASSISLLIFGFAYIFSRLL